ncbi:MAG: hypothetical protein IPF66_06405 [Holophagales bacterium]|nr:hypothetical protein [Holophagales bacterium]
MFLRLEAVVTGGSDVQGMSTTVVTPPAAAARVPVSNVSRCVNPGSSKWTCPSIAPGSTSRPPRLAISTSPRGSSRGPATAAIRSPSTRISAGRVELPPEGTCRSVKSRFEPIRRGS